MIPKIIHYCWFGPKQIPKELIKYIETWKKVCPEYELKLWNEESFDINSHPFTQSAYHEKKYAYVSDFVRAYALYHHGGIYLDTDVELKLCLDIFLKYQAFTGFEGIGAPFTAVWGAIPKHSLTHQVLSYYDNRTYSSLEPTNTASVSEILTEKFGVDPQKNIYQLVSDETHSIAIYPSTTFCLDLPLNFATHHFNGSWVENRKKSFKLSVHEKYMIECLNNEKSIYTEKEFLISLSQNLKLKHIGVTKIREPFWLLS